MRFIPVPPDTIIISNWRWWSDNDAEIETWIKDNLPSCTHTGMVLEFTDNKEYLLFLLKWQA